MKLPVRTAVSVSRLAVVSAALMLLVAPGCGDQRGVLGPDPAPSPALHGLSVGGFSTDGLIALADLPDLDVPRAAGALVRASQGGVVHLGGYQVSIPAGALARDTYITIELPTSLPEAGYVVAEFGPSGLTFARPVTITLPLQGASLGGTDLSRVGMAYWNGAAWEDYGGSADSDAVVSTTTHFSTYGARSRGGIDTTSGG